MTATAHQSIYVVCALAATVAVPSASAQDSFEDYFWSSRATSGFDYSAGKYGQAQTTTIAFVPVTLQTARGPLTLKLSGGWLAVSGPALILDGAATGTTAPGVNRKVSGLADTSISATYSLTQFYDRGVYIDLTARGKFPTAKFSKGLGTGEVDGTLQLDGSFAWDGFMPFATVGYQVNGSPDTLPLRHVRFGSLGVQYSWTEKVASGVVFDYRESSVATSSDPQEGTAYVSYRFTDAWSLNAYVLAGFSSNSPKAGGGLTFTYRIRPGGSPVP